MGLQSQTAGQSNSWLAGTLAPPKSWGGDGPFGTIWHLLSLFGTGFLARAAE